MNVVGKATPDELAMWLELISMLSVEDSIDLILNDRLVLHIIVYANGDYKLCVFSRYKVNNKTKTLVINKRYLLANNTFTNNQYTEMCSYIDELFGKFVKSKFSAKDIASGFLELTGAMAIMAGMTVAAACY